MNDIPSAATSLSKPHQIIQDAYKTQPHLRLAISKSGDAIGSWSESAGRFVMVAGKFIGPGDVWVECPYELLVNGEPPVKEWVEVKPAEHTKDSDCTINPDTLCCTICGVDHSDECLDCGGRGFHKATCAAMVEYEQEPDFGGAFDGTRVTSDADEGL